MDIVDEAKELIPWLDENSLVTRMAKHIEYLRLQNERLRQQNAELVKVIKAARKHCDVADDGDGNVWCPNCGAEYDDPHSDDCIILLLDDAILNVFDKIEY